VIHVVVSCQSCFHAVAGVGCYASGADAGRLGRVRPFKCHQRGFCGGHIGYCVRGRVAGGG